MSNWRQVLGWVENPFLNIEKYQAAANTDSFADVVVIICKQIKEQYPAAIIDADKVSAVLFSYITDVLMEDPKLATNSIPKIAIYGSQFLTEILLAMFSESILGEDGDENEE